MALKARFDFLTVGVLAVLGVLGLIVVLFFLSGQGDFLRTQIYTPASEGAALQSAGSCGPFRKLASVQLAEATNALQPCLASEQQQCRSAGRTFAAAENIRFGEVYSAGTQDIHWDWMCY